MGAINIAEYKIDVQSILARRRTAPLQVSDFLDFRGLAAKLGTTEQWVRRNVRRTYTRDPIPHLRFGRIIRFDWDSAEMREWLERRKATTEAQKSLVARVGDASYNLKRTEFGSKSERRRSE